LLSADRLFDGTGTAPMLRAFLEVAGDRIQAVDRAPPPAAGATPERFDFPGCTILPGLIDTHVHLIFSAAATNEAIIEQVGRESDEQLLARALENAKAALHAGLTTVRDCGGKGNLVQQVRDLIHQSKSVGPDV